MKPNFIIIGAGKSGTTTLWQALSQHPQIGMSKSKEPDFFSKDENWIRGWRWYERLFAHCEDKAAIGEASNSYSAIASYPRTIERIAEGIPDCRLIFSVRHPVTRTESDWMELRKIEEIEFSDFLRTNPLCFDKNEYLRTYEAYSGVFGEDKILVLFFEDFERDLRNVVKKCFGFLDLDQDIEFDASVHSGKSSDCRVFSPGVRKLTESTFYRDLSIYIPGSLKASLKPLLARRKLIERPVWTDQDYQDFRARFEIKSTQFLKAVGQPSDYWSW